MNERIGHPLNSNYLARKTTLLNPLKFALSTFQKHEYFLPVVIMKKYKQFSLIINITNYVCICKMSQNYL